MVAVVAFLASDVASFVRTRTIGGCRLLDRLNEHRLSSASVACDARPRSLFQSPTAAARSLASTHSTLGGFLNAVLLKPLGKGHRYPWFASSGIRAPTGLKRVI